MKRALVVYYSLGGTTRRVAHEIATALGAELDEIQDTRSRKGVLGYLQSGFESITRGLPAIRSLRDPRQFDLVVLGTPVWVGSMASPMRAYLFAHREELRDIACFCTMGGSGAEATFKEMAALCGAKDPPTFATTETDVRAGRHRSELDTFIAKLRPGLESVTLAAQ